MYFELLQIATIFIIIGSSTGQETNTFTRPKCCSDSLSPWVVKPQPWEYILRQATYQSIIRHLDFTGTLDGRLDRDQALWRQLQEAELLEDKDIPGNMAEDTVTGIVQILLLNEDKISFQIKKTDKSVYECSQKSCYSEDQSLLALWQVSKAEHPYTLRIHVKLPTTGDPIEDIYEYNGKYGLKKLNPDPLQHPNLSQKHHRFSFPQNNKNIERADFHFPNSNGGFRVGRVNPSPFLYDSPVVAPSKTEDGWIISNVRKPRPGVIVETGARHTVKGPFFETPSGPYISSDGPNGFHHIIHSLPSISPPQSLDPNQQLRGFLPSTGPVRAPSPYKTEYVYDPRYLLYYNRHQNGGDIHDTTPPATRQFKPSTEFVRYSEVDPFYHPEEETHLHTTPMTIHDFEKVAPSYPTLTKEQNKNLNKMKPKFPSSINEQLPTNLLPTTRPTKPSFQIVVSDIISDIGTTTMKSKPITRQPPKVQRPQTNPVESRFQMYNKSKLVENNGDTTKPFGEKIKSKPQKHNNVSRPTTESILVKSAYQKQKSEIKEPASTKNEFTSFTKTSNKKVNISQLSQGRKNKVKESLAVNITESKPIKNIKDYTTARNEKETTSLDLEYETTTDYNEQEYFTNINLETKTEGSSSYLQPDLNSTVKPVTVSAVIPTENSKMRNTTPEVDTDSTIYDYYYSDETTESNDDTTNVDLTNSNDSDFVTTLADNVFTVDASEDVSTTTATTESPQSQKIDGDTQESKTHNTQYRLITFPGDSVSIIANRISKTYSYKTAKGNEGKLQAKEHSVDRYKVPDVYNGNGTIL